MIIHNRHRENPVTTGLSAQLPGLILTRRSRIRTRNIKFIKYRKQDEYTYEGNNNL